MAKAPAPRKPTTAENLQATLNNPNVRKFLDMLSAMEGTTTHGYNTTFGGARVESLESHPNIQRKFRQTDGKTNSSGAFGRYGFLFDTWKGLQQQYPEQTKDMGQQSQDFGAVALIAGSNALTDVVNGRFGTAVRKVGNIWASLPTSPYPQARRSWDDVNKALGLQVPAGGARAANAQALTPEQGKKLYDVYKAGRMSPEQRADYERDFATIQKPAGATMLRAAAAPTGGSGGSGGAPVAPAQAAQATAKAAPYVLPVEIIMAYNDGSMNPQQRAEFERDYKAGVIAAPRHIPFKLQESEVPISERDYTGNRTGQFLDQSGRALGNFGKTVLGDGVIDAATAIPRAALGGAQALIQGAGSMGVEAIAGLSGLGAGAQAALTGGDGLGTAVNQIEYARNLMQTFTPQPFIAPQTTAAAGGVLAIPMHGTQAAGQANFDAYGNPLAATALQASGDALLMTLGLGRVGKPTVPTARAMPSNYVPTQQFTSPNPLQAARGVFQARDPVAQAAAASMGREVPIPVQQVREDTPSAATQAANSPDAIHDFVRSQRESLATNPADLAAQAEAMPRPAAARPAINPKNVAAVDPENPSVLQPLEAIPETDLAANGFTPKPTKTTSRKYAAPIENGERQVIYNKNGELISDQNITTYEKKTVDGDMVTVKISRDNKTGKISVIQLADAEGVYLNLDDGSRLSDEAWLKDSEGSLFADAAYAGKAQPTPRPATTLTPENPTVTIQPDAPPAPAGVVNPVLDGTYISSRTGKPYESAEAAQNGLTAGRLEATHEVGVIAGGYGLVPKRAADSITDAAPTAQPTPAPAGNITTIGSDGLSVMHGSTRADLTADQIQVVNPNAKQGRRGRTYGGFYATADAASAQNYANMGREGSGSAPTVYDVQIKPGAKILDIESAEGVTRLSLATIEKYRADGVDVVRGKDLRGQVEYAIINPEAISGLSPRAKPATPRTTQGRAFTTSQKPVDFVYDVVPIESVVKSTNADLTQNKAARPELQPRNRDSDASALQINTITNLLNPEWLAESPKFSDGAPTVFGSEAVAGHGRLAAIERRYAQGVGGEYRQFIIQKAAELGIDPARLAGVERPVLVRRIKSDADAQMIAQDSNAPTTLRMTTGEQARIDAKALPDLGKLARGEDGEMNIPASYDFIRDFMSALPVAERGDLMTADGRISQNAVRRIQAAVSEKAYQDADLIARFTEAADADGKRISAALQKQAGAVAALAEAAAKGERYPTTLGADLAQAANKYADIKATGLTIKNYLDQGKLVDDGLSAGAIEALVFFGENANSGRAISEYIQGKIAEVEAKGSPMQDSLFQSSRAQKEAEAVRKQYEGTPQWMQAPDGTPTKLSEQQWVQVRTPSFKEWFGDWENNPKGASKVVDENGEPLVVYHGTGAVFDSFAGDVSFFTPRVDYGHVKNLPVKMDIFLNIRNPYKPSTKWLVENAAHAPEKVAELKQSGYDGLFWTKDGNIRVGKSGWGDDKSQMVAFDPTQIKSATGNSGAFDSTNPNIYMQANKPQAAAIGERIAEQAKAAGRPAKEATQAGKLAEAYYAATAKALGLTPDEVFAKVGLSVERGDVGGANAALRLGDREHSMVFGENANASSFIHESGHHFLETHAKLADESPKIQADVDAVMTWAGHDGRAWSDLTASQKREVHEKFAESFEQYLLTGKAPTKGLKKVFEDFKKWMTDVYTSLTEFAETNPRAELSPDIVAVMDHMLGGNKAEKAANAARGKGRKKSAPITDELLDFKRSAPVAGGVSPALHQSRYDVLRDIGLTDDQIRGGSVEGDLKRLEWDAELAKYDTDYGVKMKEQLELERQKLREYGDGVVESMGGTPKATPETRGAAIVRPLEAYQAWYRDKIKAFYKLADEQGAMTGGIELRGLEAKLKEDSAYHNEPLQGMRKSVRSFMFEQRLLDARGNIKPMSAKQAETVRKHLNSIRTFETGSVIGELNSLIDDAVFSTLNRSVYGEARAVNTQYHRIFSNPKGMASLLDVDGINRKISHEKVAANVAALAETNAVQFRHIMRQLEDMPTPELQKMADQAIGEIRAQIAEKITAYDPTKPDTVAAIGKALAPYRGDKLREIFGEKGAQKLETFVAAHGILRKVDAQPSGTASMLRNIATKGSEVVMTMGGTAAGGAMAGPAGAAAGAVLGQQVGAKIKGAIAQAVDKRSYGKAMSPRQLETMKQSYDASGRRLAALPETEAATTAAADNPNSTRARVTNARLERTKQWIEFYSKLTDEQKAAVKKLGAAAWLLSVSGLGDNQANDDGENR